MKENAERARGLDTSELQKQVKDTAEQMFRLRFQMSMGQMEGLKKMRSARKERARMLTVLRERELGVTAPTTEAAAAPAKKTAAKKSAAKPVKTAAKPPAAKPAAKTAAKPAGAKKTTAKNADVTAKKTEAKAKKSAK
jgi:large subunit ribosomal protein L29